MQPHTFDVTRANARDHLAVSSGGYESMPVRLGPTSGTVRSPGEGAVRLAP